MSILDYIFGEKPVELKLSPSPTSSARVLMPMAEPLTYDTDSLRRYARRNELVYACIEKKAQAACDAELVVERKNGDEWERVDGHPLVALLNKPNPYDDGESFRRSWVSSENFSDMFYAEIVRSGAGRPVELYPLNPANIRPDYRATANGWELWRYIYTLDGYETYYKPEELLIRRRHAYGTLYGGISAVQIALGSVDADTALTDYVRAFFNNGGAPSGIINIKGRTVTSEEMEAIQQKFVHRYGRSGVNRGGPAVFQADDMAYTNVGSRLDELDSDGITQKIESRICMAFGVPPVLVGAYVGLKNVNQKASFQGAMEEFWINTMSPELKAIRTFLTWNLLPEFENIEAIKRGDIRVNWDMSQVGAMQESLDDIYKRSIDAYTGGIMTLNEARTAIKLPPIDGDEGDALKAPQQLNSGNMGGMEEEEETAPPKQLTDGKSEYVYGSATFPDWKMIDGKLVEEGTWTFEGLIPKSMVKPDVLDADTLEKKSDYRRELTPIEQTIDIKAIETAYESGKEALTRTILGIRGELYKQGAREGAKLRDKDLHTLTLTAPKGASEKVRQNIWAAYSDGATQVAKESGQPVKQLIISRELKGIVDDLIKRLTELTMSRIMNEVTSAIINTITALGVLGYDRDDIEDEIERRLDERSDAPYEAYARQATNSAVNAGRREEMQARQDDIEKYYWSAILDKNVCDPCAELDGAEAERLDQLPDAPYSECEGLANCRCFVIAQFVGEGEAV